MSVQVKFTVSLETWKGQCVCLVGDGTHLGQWQPQNAVEMQRDFTGQNWKQWTCIVTLDRHQTYGYRYFVCKQPQTSPRVKNSNNIPASSSQEHKAKALHPMTIYRWETNIRPRYVSVQSSEPEDLIVLPEDVFGMYDGLSSTGKGWLINQCEIQIRLHGNPIYMWKARHREQIYSIKCIAMDYSALGGPPFEESDDDSRGGPDPCLIDDVLVCNLSHEDCQPQLQGPAGIFYNRDDYVVFRSQMPDPELQGFQLDFFVCETNRAPKFVGSSHLLPVQEKESQHYRKCPIIGINHKPIGEVSVEYLIVRPVDGLHLNMETSYQSHWKWRELGEKSLDIGHRGMGASYSQVNALKENTIASFMAAVKHGADFIEFDVLLSKDKHPVIYHDFSVKVKYSKKKKHKVQSELFEIPVKSLTLSQLQSMRLFASSANGVEINDEENDEDSTDPFPTLEQVLTVVDENTGFDIEIKYPQQDVNETWEMENYFDINENLDHILKVVFANAGSRKIVFSSFDADTCVLLQLKQNKYPVFFLHQGATQHYVPYKDYRAFSFRNGISFALSEHLLGVALNSEDLLRNMDLIDRILKMKLVLFVWGNDNNNPQVIRKLRDLNVHGIIYDRIDCHKPELQQPEFQLTSPQDEASFMKVVKTETEASVQFLDSTDRSYSPAGSSASTDGQDHSSSGSTNSLDRDVVMQGQLDRDVVMQGQLDRDVVMQDQLELVPLVQIA